MVQLIDWRTSSHKCGGYTGEDGEACVVVALVSVKD